MIFFLKHISIRKEYGVGNKHFACMMLSEMSAKQPRVVSEDFSTLGRHRCGQSIEGTSQSPMKYDGITS